MNESQIPCSKCSLLISQYVKIQCSHNLCHDCFNKYCRNQKIQGSQFVFKCQICLKTQRISHDIIPISFNGSQKQKPQFFKNSSRINIIPQTRQYKQQRKGVLNKNNMINNNKGDKNMNNSELYCFTCNSNTFSMSNYLNGEHANHRVKTYENALVQLKQKNIRYINILEYKHGDLLQKEVILQKQLIGLSNDYGQSVNEIDNYYERIMDRIRQKRNEMIIQAEIFYRQYSNDIKKEIDNIRNSAVQVKRLIEMIKQFYFGEQSINQLVNEDSKLKNYLQIKQFKLKSICFPKLIQTLDLEFHVANSYKFYKSNQKIQDYHKTIQKQTSNNIPNQKIIRKVKLLEKVQNKFYIRNQPLFK